LKKTVNRHIVLSILITLFVWSCSTKKDAFLNRTLHTTATKYNVLYNGKNAYNEEKKQIDDNYEDDFWSILPIEPLSIKEEELALPTTPFGKDETSKQSESSGFAKAEEKAVKSIQKHSMNISGNEKNKQIDDAYFLLGKSRYYDQRFIPALETFKFMIKKYPESKLFNQARVWEAKTLIRLGSEDDAIYKLGRYLTKNEGLNDVIKADAHTALAMAYTNQDSIQQIINHLNRAIFHPREVRLEDIDSLYINSKNYKRDKYVKINDFSSKLNFSKKGHKQATRNAFILAQLYHQENKIDSSNAIFEKIINSRKSPYRYRIYAQIERAKNYNKETDDAESIIETLEKLTRNRDNRPYLDGIYYQLGKIKLKNNQIDEATSYFKKSVSTKLAKNYQKGLAQEELGNISFDKGSFVSAGSYYDSVFQLTRDKNTLRMRRLARKRKSLDEVISNEKIRSRNDSILNLVAMNEDNRKTFFNDYIKKIKKEEEENRIALLNEQKSSGFGGAFLNNPDSKQSSKNAKFYFYNTQAVGFGQKEFQNVWGNRVLEDNWRLSSKKGFNLNSDEDIAQVEDNFDKSKRFDLDYYLSTIPSEEKQIDSISATRNKAYYNLGLIYKEQFKKYELATDRLEKLLNQQPKENLVLPIYYHLYKSFEHFDVVKSNFYKEKITTKYADSRYAQLINNPETAISLDDDENSPENVYKKTYQLYLDENYSETFEECNKSISRFADTQIVPKFELLKSYAAAKLDGKEAFVKALTFVSINYPNTEEGKHAIRILASLRGEIIEIEKTKRDDARKQDDRKKGTSSRTKNDKTNRRGKKVPSNEKMMERIKNRKNNGSPNKGKSRD